MLLQNIATSTNQEINEFQFLIRKAGEQLEGINKIEKKIRPLPVNVY